MKKNTILFIVLVILAASAFWVFKKSGKSTLADKPLTEFAIEDTSRVVKFVITDHTGERAVLERVPGNKLWKLNNKYFAREDAVNLVLKTINRIRIRGNVGDAARDNMLKLLATSGKKVEIYTGGEEPEKIYYVGVATPDHTGTVMLLEIPEIGRSEEPYITHIEGFTGFLSTRFFTSEMEWRYTGIFDYPQLEFKEVTVVNHIIPEQSFQVKFDGKSGINFMDAYNASTNEFGHQATSFDSVAVRNFLLNFKRVHVESFNTLLKPQERDSILNLPPTYTVTVKGNNDQISKVDLYLKKAVKDVFDEQGNRIPWDLGYLWARTSDGELGLAQTYTFDPIVLPASSYSPK